MTATADLIAGYRELCEARKGYHKAKEMYEGCYDDIAVSERMKMLLAKAGVESLDQLNYAAIPVDAVAEKLQVKGIAAVDPTGQVVDEAGQALTVIRVVNKLGIQLPGLIHRVCEFGDAYVLVWEVRDLETDQVVGVDVVVESPMECRTFADPDRPLITTYGIKTWETADPTDSKRTATTAVLYYPDRLEWWDTEPGTSPDDPKSWTKRPDDVPNQYGRVPLFRISNGMPFGHPEHERAYGAQELLIKLVKGQAATIDYQSFRQKYGLIDPEQDRILGQSIEPFSPEDEDEDPESPAKMSSLRADPGSVWELPGYRSVGEFSAADPQVFLLPFDRYVRSVAELTTTPLHRVSSVAGPEPSGVARRYAEAPFVNKVRNRQDMLGDGLNDSLTFALTVLGFEDVRAVVSWAPATIVDDVEGWTVIQNKQSAGVPQDVTLVEAGYDPERVAKWMEQNGQQYDLARRIQLLTDLGMALQTLGTAAALQVVDPGDVQFMAVTILGDLLPAPSGAGGGG